MATTTITTEHEHYLNKEYGVRSWLLTTDHKRIAVLYLISITFFFFIEDFLRPDQAGITERSGDPCRPTLTTNS
jgi:hypothetical protein